MKQSPFQLIVIGASAGGIQAYLHIVKQIPADFKTPVVLVQHILSNQTSSFARILNNQTPLAVLEIEDKLAIKPGHIYTAPPGYHVLIEQDGTFALSVDAPVHFARPSIDVLFHSAANVYADRLIGVLLTGANADGAAGLKHIQQAGGTVMVEDPESAHMPEMPRSGLNATGTSCVYTLETLPDKLIAIVKENDD